MVSLLENPLRVGLQHDRIPAPQILVIFGASGDLTHRKLVPALYQMRLRAPPAPGDDNCGRRPSGLEPRLFSRPPQERGRRVWGGDRKYRYLE